MRTFLLFTTPMCPKCPDAKEALKESGLKGEYIDASQSEGLEKAKKYEIMEVPTVVFIEDGKEPVIVTGPEEIREELKK